MDIHADNNNIYITIDDQSVSDGQSFSNTLKSIDWTNIKDSKEYRKFKPNNIEIEIPYNVFLETVKLWNIQFNTIEDGETKKTIENVMSLSSVISINHSLKHTEIEHELINKYGLVKNQVIHFKIENYTLYNTDYMLFIYPQKFNSFNVQLVPIDKYNAIKPKEKAKHFYLAIKIPLSYLSNQLTDIKAIPNKVGENVEIIIPTATSEIKLDNTSFKDNLFFLINSVTPKNINSSDITRKYLEVCRLAVCPEAINAKNSKDSKKYGFIFKAWHTDNVIQIIQADTTTHTSCGDFVITGKIIFLYSELLFPLFIQLTKVQSDIKYNYCSNSKERSRYGFFSEGYLGLEVQKDQPLFNDFNGFFVYDNEKEIKLDTVNSKSLNVPDF